MRADRLLSILMILQARRKVTAGELARELEVSERTIYRDITALNMAGIPVYSLTGPEGGYALVETYQTTLTGLTERETGALFMLITQGQIPAPLAELGVSQELKAALLKLTAALPRSRRKQEQHARQRIHLDAAWWDQGSEPTPHIQTIYQAVWEDLPLEIAYEPIPNLEIRQIVMPYGLVAKAGAWYLVCGRAGDSPGLHVHRVAHLLDAAILPQEPGSTPAFEHPQDFDLPAFWERWCAEQTGRTMHYPVQVRLSPALLPHLPRYFGRTGRELQRQTPDPDGWITATLSFESLEAARARLLSLGAAVEVLAPYPLRRSIQDIAGQTARLYQRD